MGYPFSTQSVLLIGVLAVVLPIIYRIVSSPLTLLLISPFVLLFLGLAFLALHVFLGHILDARKPKSNNKVAYAARPLVFSTPAAWQAVLTRSQWSQNTPQSFPPLLPDSPVVSAAINEILIMIVRDFVLTWYREISSSPSFPVAVSSVLHASLTQMLDRAAGIDLASLVVKRILPQVTEHIELFRQSEVALRGAGLERRLTQSEELDILLASRYSAGRDIGKLHPAIENLSTTFTRQTEEMHLRQLVDKALPHVLPETENQSNALKIVVREIVACAVLYPVMEMVSDPDFWNRMIDQVAGAAIHQQKLVTKVRNVLEAQAPRPRQRYSSVSSSALPTELITIRTDVRQFESFLRSINRCSSLLDARRLKNDVIGEIRRTRILLANHEKDDWINGERTEDVVAFLDRLYTAKRKVEQRIVELGGEDESQKQAIQDPGTPAKAGITLRDVLSNPSSLSYFMEFMDRRNRSLLVQFWLTVETFKNPLESVDSGSDDDEDETIQDASTAITVKEDISMINDLYFSGPAPHPVLSSIPKKYVESIREFARSELNSSPSAQRRVRRSVLLAQRQVERDMEQDFEEFGSSELWFRVIKDADFINRKAPTVKDKRFSGVHLSSSVPSAKPPTVLPRSESTPGLPMKRTASSGSERSAKSTPSHPVQTKALPSNIEVLMSPVLDSTTDYSRAPLFDDPDDKAQRVEEQRMEEIHAALTDIMALEDPQDKSSVSSGVGGGRVSMFLSPRHRRSSSDGDISKSVPTLEEELPEEADEIRPSFTLAGPGDLQLSYEIARLGDKINSLQAQEVMLDNLIKKAELTGDNQELRLLNTSKASLNRELRELKFQKTQYEQQESANRLISDRTKVSIVSSTVAEEDGKSVVRYLVEVQQLASDGSFSSGWVVARRYNEFLSMHNKLRDKYALVRNLEFPGKRLVTALSGAFVDTRRVGLEKYMQNLVAISAVCESDELRAFLSRESPFVASEHPITPTRGFSGSDLVRNVYKSVTESIDDMFFGQSMLDVMILRLTRQAAEFAGIVGSGVNDEDLVAQALNSGKTAPEAALMQMSPDLKPLEGESSTSTFSAPICDLLLAIFELDEKNNWLRRQAIVIILQQVLGGTIERKIRETVKSLLDDAHLLTYIKSFRDGLWPGGKLKPPGVPRTADEKMKTRDDANRKLSALFPDLAANVIGRSNARRGARRIFAVLQNRRLNQHIAYTVVDEVFSALFPESNSNHHSSS
ncbi:PhoX domain-containing protein [Dendrothele bispora CBS 962.96]|uniref:PhoX domain-containing protein n=1 Tax=Dendrothele bispora (strain CBS 962.96) TaxID=1314807 RepID=A0A4S8MVX1_DENBC|nr:PhoX domain-containing protein [Dendrothele bispora CBS 962.96]